MTMNFKDRFYLITILGLIIYILFLHNWYKQSENKETVYSYKEEIQIDTITFTRTYYDTIKVAVPKAVTYYDTLYNDTLKKYVEEFEDSLIEGTIYAMTKGELLDWGFYYKPLFPKYINKTITNTITKLDTIKVKDNSVKLFLGINSNLSKQVEFDAYPVVSLQKDRFLINAGYSVFNKSTIIGIHLKLN